MAIARQLGVNAAAVLPSAGMEKERLVVRRRCRTTPDRDSVVNEGRRCFRLPSSEPNWSARSLPWLRKKKSGDGEGLATVRFSIR